MPSQAARRMTLKCRTGPRVFLLLAQTFRDFNERSIVVQTQYANIKTTTTEQNGSAQSEVGPPPGFPSEEFIPIFLIPMCNRYKYKRFRSSYNYKIFNIPLRTTRRTSSGLNKTAWLMVRASSAVNWRGRRVPSRELRAYRLETADAVWFFINYCILCTVMYKVTAGKSTKNFQFRKGYNRKKENERASGTIDAISTTSISKSRS